MIDSSHGLTSEIPPLFALCYTTHGINNFVRRLIFYQIAGGTIFQNTFNILTVIVGTESKDADKGYLSV